VFIWPVGTAMEPMQMACQPTLRGGPSKTSCHHLNGRWRSIGEDGRHTCSSVQRRSAAPLQSQLDVYQHRPDAYHLQQERAVVRQASD
jgi:hypothetical protein